MCSHQPHVGLLPPPGTGKGFGREKELLSEPTKDLGLSFCGTSCLWGIPAPGPGQVLFHAHPGFIPCSSQGFPPPTAWGSTGNSRKSGTNPQCPNQPRSSSGSRSLRGEGLWDHPQTLLSGSSKAPAGSSRILKAPRKLLQGPNCTHSPQNPLGNQPWSPRGRT